MAVLTTFTGATELEERIATEDIDAFTASFEYVPSVGVAICWTRPSPMGSVAVKFSRWNELSVPSGTKTESDVFTDVALDMAEESITPGLVGFRMPISDEATAAAGPGVTAGMLVQAIMALDSRMDADILAGASSATNTIGGFTDDLSLENLRAAVASYKALEIPGSPQHALVLGHAAAADLLGAIHSSSATLAFPPGSSVSLQAISGYLGQFYGLQIFESGKVAAESPGHNCFITPIGFQQSGLGLALKELPNLRPTRGDEAEQRAVDFIVCRAWYGAGMVNRKRILELRAN